VASSPEVVASPFHRDELEAQRRAGGGPRGASVRTFMPDQHRSFFALLPYLVIGVADERGWPVASMLTGEPGFAHSPDPATLRIDAVLDRGDPASFALRAGQEIGILGIDFATRRRNRVNGMIAALDATGFTVAVRQSFGNCPQYIQQRTVLRVPPTQPSEAARVLTALDGRTRSLIAGADTFFVASRSGADGGALGGADVSHRGGRPGFVRVEGDQLTIPDFSGNRYFNTLGNLLGEPRAGLLFVDFETGDVLQLQGRVAIDWSKDAARAVEGAERLWRFDVARAWYRPSALPLRWSFVGYSPVALRTGTWG